MATKRSKIVLFFNYFYFCSISSIPHSLLTYFRDMIDLKFRQHLLLHIWKIIRHYCIAEKSWCSPFKIKRHNGLKFSTIFGAKIQIFCWNEFWCFEPIFLKSSFHECLLKGWHWKKAERRASSNSWMQFQGLKCSRVGLLDVFWPP